MAGEEESAVRRKEIESRADGVRTIGAVDVEVEVEDNKEVPGRRQGLIFLHSI